MAQDGTAEAIDEAVVSRFGFESGQVVQEFLYDADCDDELREALEAVTGEGFVGEDFGEVTDLALVWFRDGDDDLADLLMDAQTLLDDGGSVWLLTPKAGTAGHVEQRDIEEASSLAGLHATSTFVAGANWTATHLVEKGRSK